MIIRYNFLKHLSPSLQSCPLKCWSCCPETQNGRLFLQKSRSLFVALALRWRINFAGRNSAILKNGNVPTKDTRSASFCEDPFSATLCSISKSRSFWDSSSKITGVVFFYFFEKSPNELVWPTKVFWQFWKKNWWFFDNSGTLANTHIMCV